MEFAIWLNILLALIIVIAFVTIMAYIYLNNASSKLDDLWFKLNLSVRKRSDLIPLLIEYLKPFSLGINEKELIELRSDAMHVTECNGQKVNNELMLSNMLNEIFAKISDDTKAKKDHNLLGIKKLMNEYGQKIEKQLEIYNSKVRLYNKVIGLKFLTPLFSLVKVRERNIFEYEV